MRNSYTYTSMHKITLPCIGFDINRRTDTAWERIQIPSFVDCEPVEMWAR